MCQGLNASELFVNGTLQMTCSLTAEKKNKLLTYLSCKSCLFSVKSDFIVNGKNTREIKEAKTESLCLIIETQQIQHLD